MRFALGHSLQSAAHQEAMPLHTERDTQQYTGLSKEVWRRRFPVRAEVLPRAMRACVRVHTHGVEDGFGLNVRVQAKVDNEGCV